MTNCFARRRRLLGFRASALIGALLLAAPAAFAQPAVALDAATRLLRHSAAARTFTHGATTALAINPTIGDSLNPTGLHRATDLDDFINKIRR